ncbi:hypothetical protein B0T10DRAFT_540127 [Thelonectria olida]|uniref:Uncharacterized protein n=1 Tax=Thelonectria olida TaxID=1576542 RepID=A0A9P9AI88_9HYPO|nr:hypothetical protein B0T10DRAFT_540127 [Thelonectria olida]
MSLQPARPTIRAMGSNSLPLSPSGTKSVMHRTSKCASSSAATIHHHDRVTHTAGIDGRYKRCDGEFPCKRCTDDGSVCTTSVRKKMEYKKLPQGYAEVLENTQSTLIAIVHKLYSMVLNNQPWELGEPELNDRGQPVIHNIAQKLGCIRPNSDIDLPVHSAFHEAGMAELAWKLEDQQKENEHQNVAKDADSSVCNRTEQALSSGLDGSDFEYDNEMTLPSQSFTDSTSDYGFAPPPPEIDAVAMLSSQSPSMTNFPAWSMAIKPQPSDLTMQFLQQPGVLNNTDLVYQGLVESEFDTVKPPTLSCLNPEIITGMSDPMIYSSYNSEAIDYNYGPVAYNDYA